jgi:hypothetical protein
LLRADLWADVPSHIAKTGHNALLGSRTVDVRALYDFLDLDEPQKPDDIVAGDWLFRRPMDAHP